MKFILSIDCGSTGIRVALFNKRGVFALEYEKIPILSPQAGWMEYDPHFLWQSLLSIINRIFQRTDVHPKDIAVIGLANQRGTFLLWDKQTGNPVINFISWNDLRAVDTCEEMNKSKKWRLMKKLALVGSKITRNTTFTASSMLEFTTFHSSIRMKWILDNIEGLRERCKTGEIAFGTLDSWFIYKLTGGKIHATDYSNAAATGLLNPFTLGWNRVFFWLFGIPIEVVPDVKDSSDDFGFTDSSLFEGIEIPIRSVIGDQQAALFGQCCFSEGEVKISQGSGAFVSMNAGKIAKLSKRGLLPSIAWVIDGEPTYMLEGHVATVGTLIDWLGQGIGLSDTPKVLNEYAAQCKETGGVIFIPTPSGINFPYYSPRTRANILGLSLNTQRCHVARAVFEGIALRILDILTGMEKDTKTQIRLLKADGGVSKSDILLQCIANFTNLEVNRAPELDMTATGAAYLAGLNVGFWQDLDELKQIYSSSDPTTFRPMIDSQKRQEKIKQWKQALKAILTIH